MISGLLPNGNIRTDTIGDRMFELHGSEWPEADLDRLWILKIDGFGLKVADLRSKFLGGSSERSRKQWDLCVSYLATDDPPPITEFLTSRPPAGLLGPFSGVRFYLFAPALRRSQATPSRAASWRAAADGSGTNIQPAATGSKLVPVKSVFAL